MIRSIGKTVFLLYITLTVMLWQSHTEKLPAYCCKPCVPHRLLLTVLGETWGTCTGWEMEWLGLTLHFPAAVLGLVDWNTSRERVLIPKYLHTSLLIMGRRVPEGRTKLCKQLWDGNTCSSPFGCFDRGEASRRSVASCCFLQVKENIVGVISPLLYFAFPSCETLGIEE